MPIDRISVLSVPVADQQKAKTFYTEVLGFHVVRDTPFQGDARWIQLAPKESDTSITLVTWFADMPAGSLDGMVLTTSDIEATCAEIRAKGLELPAVETAEWGKYVTFSDPDGNGWVLHQPI